jgi:hypothetical protein
VPTPSTTVYFDSTDTTCLGLLQASLRGSSDLARLAAECEADLINYYTKPIRTRPYPSLPFQVLLTTQSFYTDLGNGTGVFLKGYTIDPTQCLDAFFVLSMRRTIAMIIEWRFPQTQRDVQVLQFAGASGTLAAGQKTWISFDDLPPGWSRYLSQFDTREIGWSV